MHLFHTTLQKPILSKNLSNENTIVPATEVRFIFTITVFWNVG
jgi:hypothetical protein